MNALDLMLATVDEQAVTCDVYRASSSGAYSDDATKVDTVDIAIFSPTSSSEVVVEGSGQETTMTGLLVPQFDANGDPVEVVQVNDELRLQSNTSKRYDVRVKEGFPNEFDPEVWRCGLNRANASE